MQRYDRYDGLPLVPWRAPALLRFWDPAEGWGVIDSPETPSGCWAHFTHIQDDADADTAARGFRELSNGQPVGFTWEKYPQDGYEFRVIAVWPAMDASP